MNVKTFPDAGTTAREAARFIASAGRRAIEDRGRFLLALSGGSTPALMLRFLAAEDLDWSAVHVFQVDERVAPDGHKDRNLVQLKEFLVSNLPNRPAGVWIMPVTDLDLDLAADNYEKVLRSVAGHPPVLDLVHLGLGDDGHTASLIPGDPVLDVSDREVAVTNRYKRRRRMTLTYPVLNRARCVLWLVSGSGKENALNLLRRGDTSIPAGRVNAASALLLTDSTM